MGNYISLRKQTMEKNHEFNKKLERDLSQLDEKLDLLITDKYKLSEQEIHEILSEGISGLSQLLDSWNEFVEKSEKNDDISEVIESLLHTIEKEEDFNKKDATKLFIKLSFLSAVAYAIDIKDYQMLDDLIKYDYEYDKRINSYACISGLCKPGFIHSLVGNSPSEYSYKYVALVNKIVQDKLYNERKLLEADIFLEFINKTDKNYIDEYGKKWHVIESKYSKDKYKNNFKFLLSLKRESISKNILILMNISNIEEFKKLLNKAPNCLIYEVISKDEISILK